VSDFRKKQKTKNEDEARKKEDTTYGKKRKQDF